MLDQVKTSFATTVLKCLGWTYKPYSTLTVKELEAKYPKMVIFGEPHTSFWDIVYMKLFFWYYRTYGIVFPVNAKYFFPGVGWVLKSLGAFPVDTKKNTGIVGALVQQFKTVPGALQLHIGPSGTRKKTEYWRSGFYQVALQANVPIVMAYLDASTNTFGWAEPFYLTGNVKEDMDKIREFYQDKRGFCPEGESRIRLKSEDQEN